MDRRTLPPHLSDRKEKFALLRSLGKNTRDAYAEVAPGTARPYEGGRRYDRIPEIRARIKQFKGKGKIDPDDSDSIRAAIAEIHDRAMGKEPVLDKHGKGIGVWKSELVVALNAAKALAARTGALERVDAGALTEDMTDEQGRELVLQMADKYGLLISEAPVIEAVPETGTDG